MKNDIIYCRSCKIDFDIIVNKKFKLEDKFHGLPDCNHHKDLESIQDYTERLK